MKEIDLKENVFAIQDDRRMLVGYCAMFLDGKLMYAGRINDSPEPQTGWVMLLHPDDFDSLMKAYRRSMN